MDFKDFINYKDAKNLQHITHVHSKNECMKKRF